MLRPLTRSIAPVALFLSIAFSAACDRRSTASQSESQTEASQPGQAGPKKIHAGDLEVLEFVTRGANEDDTLPMIVAVHGMGDRPENWLDFFSTFPAPARIILPRAPEPWGDGFSWFSYPPKSIDDLSRGVAAAGDRVARAIAELSEKFKTQNRPIVTGFSQGGFVSFDLAVHHPNVIDSAFPMSGGLPEPLWPRSEAEGRSCAPIFAVHGTSDPIVPISMARDAIAKISSLGGTAELREFPRIVHTVTPSMREEILKRVAARAQSGTRRGDGGP